VLTVYYVLLDRKSKSSHSLRFPAYDRWQHKAVIQMVERNDLFLRANRPTQCDRNVTGLAAVYSTNPISPGRQVFSNARYIGAYTDVPGRKAPGTSNMKAT
jgi:hypothetical protein